MGLGRFFRRAFGSRREGEGSSADLNPAPTPHTSLPEWAAHFKSVEDLNTFESLVAEYFRKRRIPAQVQNGVVVLGALRDEGGGLPTVSQICASHSREEWGGLIAQHFDTLERAKRLQRPDDPKFASFDWCEQRLVPRLFEELPDAIRNTAVLREDIPGLTTVLAVDLPEVVGTVHIDHIKGWPHAPDTWFRTAIDNGKRLAPLHVEKVPLETGGELFAAECNNQIAAWALGFEDHPEYSGAFGSLVSMPTKSLMLVLPFHGVDVVEKMTPFMAITAGAFRDGPGSLSANIYWVRAGTWIRIPWSLDDKGFSVTPPDELVELLNSLAGDDGHSENTP